MVRSYNPHPCTDGFGLFPVRSPLLGECSLFLRVLRCFSSPGSLRLAYVFSKRSCWFATGGFPIRTSPDHSLYTAPRGFSQCPTSFFGIRRLGIHHKPCVASLRDAETSVLLHPSPSRERTFTYFYFPSVKRSRATSRYFSYSSGKVQTLSCEKVFLFRERYLAVDRQWLPLSILRGTHCPFNQPVLFNF